MVAPFRPSKTHRKFHVMPLETKAGIDGMGWKIF